jgi:hypothetical protein
MSDRQSKLRTHVLELLTGGHGHVDFDGAIKGVPVALRGKRPPKAEHTLWQLLEHLRIAQWDIVGFSRDSDHASPEWPEGYWPEKTAPKSPAAWTRSVSTVRADLQAMKDLVADPENNLLKPFAHGNGQTLLREALLLADHNAYHVGQIVVVRRLLGIWPAKGR